MGKILTIEITDVKSFKNIIITAEQILNEIKFEADKEGIRFRGLDGGHTCFLNVDLKREYFLNYRINQPESIIIDTGELLKIMKRIKNDNSLTIKFDSSQMIIEANSTKNNKTFKIYAVDMEYDTPRMPNIPYTVETTINFDEFKDNVGDAELYSDVFKIKATNKNIQIVTNSMLGEYNSKLYSEGTLDECESMFKIELIKKFFKLTGISEDLILKMGKDKPLLICFKDEDLQIQYMVAPRISEDY